MTTLASNKKILIFSVFFTFFLTPVGADEDPSYKLSDYKTAFVIHELSSGSRENLDPQLSSRRLTPCSTFKIYNTLIALKLGLLKGPDEPWYQWDGVRRDIKEWNQDLTLRQAFRVSAVPAFQNLARQIGEVRMKEYINRLGYGNRDISSGVDIFWLPREGKKSILISADEQIELLKKLIEGKLPFSKKNISILKEIMKVDATPKGTLYAKTGSATDASGKASLGWFVGFLESHKKTYVFACNMTEGENPSGKTSKAWVIDYFRSKGLL